MLWFPKYLGSCLNLIFLKFWCPRPCNIWFLHIQNVTAIYVKEAKKAINLVSKETPPEELAPLIWDFWTNWFTNKRPNSSKDKCLWRKILSRFCRTKKKFSKWARFFLRSPDPQISFQDHLGNILRAQTTIALSKTLYYNCNIYIL